MSKTHNLWAMLSALGGAVLWAGCGCPFTASLPPTPITVLKQFHSDHTASFVGYLAQYVCHVLGDVPLGADKKSAGEVRASLIPPPSGAG